MRTKMLLLWVIWTLASHISCAVATAATIKLRLNGLEVAIDKDSGCIVYLASPDAGVILKAAPESAGVLDVAYPPNSYVPLRLTPQHSKARVEEEANGLTNTWGSLGPHQTKISMPSGKGMA